MPETAIELVAAHRSGAETPERTVARAYARLRAHADPAVFITVRDEAEAIAAARALKNKDAPLYGVPVAVKDNIDVAGMPTTAACPAFSYMPKRDATAVARLRAAGAVIIGKTNLDQFATGLVGVRSPYGVPRNAFNRKLVPGGSSSGSAVAVAAGIVPIALGTDTAGSGRVPAGLNNIVGLKPTLGLVSTAGVVPACRTLDCVSVFALTVDDAWLALEAAAGFDRGDPYSRNVKLDSPSETLTIGVPNQGQRLFFGDRKFEAAYGAAIDRLAALGCTITEIDIEPFYETARLLYEGPWVAERALTVRALLASNPDAIHPITRKIISSGLKPTAMDAFSALYRLQELRRVADVTFDAVDALALPTAPTAYAVEDVLADPIQLNSRLGTYTNFVNLLDLCGLALPAGIVDANIPFGVTLLAPAGKDAQIASLGRQFHSDTGLPLGALNTLQPKLVPDLPRSGSDEIALAVVGAHLSGLPLNDELLDCGARLLQKTRTAPNYRLFALSTTPPKPGMLRVADGAGTALEVEVWGMSAGAFAQFVNAVPPPLSIGNVELADGSLVKGFLVEAIATEVGRDISRHGGWRSYLAATGAPASST